MAKKKTSASITAYEARATGDHGSLSDFMQPVIGKAIFRERVISFDWLPKGGYVAAGYKLTSQDGVHYFGQAIVNPGTVNESVAKVQAVLYSNKLGHMLVAEEIYEDGNQQHWLVQFYDGKVTP